MQGYYFIFHVFILVSMVNSRPRNKCLLTIYGPAIVKIETQSALPTTGGSGRFVVSATYRLISMADRTPLTAARYAKRRIIGGYPDQVSLIGTLGEVSGSAGGGLPATARGSRARFKILPLSSTSWFCNKTSCS